jgi:hypothetical protein
MGYDTSGLTVAATRENLPLATSRLASGYLGIITPGAYHGADCKIMKAMYDFLIVKL